MKKIIFVLLIGITVLYLLYQNQGRFVLTFLGSKKITNPFTDYLAAQNFAVPKTYKDGTYTGAVENAYYGSVQVRTTIAGGKLSDVSFLQYPQSTLHAQVINSLATPALSSEAITAQGAQVDVVTGATATSAAFISSLGSALSQAAK
jgi:uncharacterized protein with FMN-binding domain